MNQNTPNDVLCLCNQGNAALLKLQGVANLEASGISTKTTTSTKMVIKKPASIPITLKIPTEAPTADSSHVASSRIQVNRAITIAPYYRVEVTGQIVKVPSKSFQTRNDHLCGRKKVDAIASIQSAKTTLEVLTNLVKGPQTPQATFVAKTPSLAKQVNRSAVNDIA